MFICGKCRSSNVASLLRDNSPFPMPKLTNSTCCNQPSTLMKQRNAYSRYEARKRLPHTAANPPPAATVCTRCRRSFLALNCVVPHNALGDSGGVTWLNVLSLQQKSCDFGVNNAEIEA